MVIHVFEWLINIFGNWLVGDNVGTDGTAIKYSRVDSA